MIHFTRPVLTSQQPRKKLSHVDQQKYTYLKHEENLTQSQQAMQLKGSPENRLLLIWSSILFIIIGLQLAAQFWA